MFKSLKNWLKPPADNMLNGGLALNHFRDAEYRNVLGHDIHECCFELNKLLDKYNCHLKLDGETDTIWLADLDTGEAISAQVYQ